MKDPATINSMGLPPRFLQIANIKASASSKATSAKLTKTKVDQPGKHGWSNLREFVLVETTDTRQKTYLKDK